MKVLSYMKTEKGSMIVDAVTEPSIDPLETYEAAVKAVKVMPEYRELQARIKVYDAAVKKHRKDGVRFGDNANVPDHVREDIKLKITRIGKQQDKLNKLYQQAKKDNPVYLLPANAILITDENAVEIKSALSFSDKFILVADVQKNKVAYELLPDNTGKKYRLPETLEWIEVVEPDHNMPVNALFEEPDTKEAGRIEDARIAAMSEEERHKEALSHKKAAQSQFLRENTLAELEQDEKTVGDCKSKAQTNYHADIAAICKKYNITF